MIQRKQSIFLALVVVIFITLFFIPVYNLAGTNTLISSQISVKMQFIPLLLISMAAISILALVAIFLYKNRKRQMTICRIGLILSLLISTNAVLFPQFFVHGMTRENVQIGNGAFLLPVIVVLFALAAYFIKKDEDLVKAADRLR